MTPPPIRIPFNRPSFAGEELALIAEALERGHLSGDGHFTKACHRFLEERLEVKKALLTTSCTHALEMAALLLDIKAGDEVILPSFTFVSTANAFVLRGATPVFADILPDTLNIDPDHVRKLVTSRTRAIVPVHYAGVGCDMDLLGAIAADSGATLVEDNAHGLFGKYRGRNLGTFGSMATLSFHETKNLTCGEGGALLINDPSLAERAEIIREKGTNRARFFRGQVDKYTWVDVGSSYLPSEILAAVLLAQLHGAAEIQAARRTLWDRYWKELQPLAARTGARLPHVPGDREQAFHMFYILFPNTGMRGAFLQHLRADGILGVHHYIPLHSSPMGRRLNSNVPLPVTDSTSETLARLPFFTGMTSSAQSCVIESALSFTG